MPSSVPLPTTLPSSMALGSISHALGRCNGGLSIVLVGAIHHRRRLCAASPPLRPWSPRWLPHTVPAHGANICPPACRQCAWLSCACGLRSLLVDLNARSADAVPRIPALATWNLLRGARSRRRSSSCKRSRPIRLASRPSRSCWRRRLALASAPCSACVLTESR